MRLSQWNDPADPEKDVITGQPAQLSTSTVKKPAAVIALKSALMKVAHEYCRRRIGAGSRPCSLKILLIVFRSIE